jgi:ABC-type spermidine/putrescine transport system permease subunit II
MSFSFLALLYLFLYAPLFVTALFSFNEPVVQTWPISGLTGTWYSEMWGNGPLKKAALFSFKISLTTVLIGIVFGTYFALLISRYVKRGSNVLLAALSIPVVLPGLVLGISLLVVFRFASITPGFWTIVAGHATFVTPIIMFVVLTRLRTLDPSFEQASFDLGANRTQTFWHVTLPAIRVALMAGALLAFTVSFDEIVVTFFLAGVDVTLPVFVWNQLRFGFTPEVNAIFTVIGVVSVFLIIAATAMLTRGGGRSSLADLTGTK